MDLNYKVYLHCKSWLFKSLKINKIVKLLITHLTFILYVIEGQGKRYFIYY